MSILDKYTQISGRVGFGASNPPKFVEDSDKKKYVYKKSTRNEVYITNKLQECPNIIKLIDYDDDEMILEFFEGFEIYKYLNKCKKKTSNINSPAKLSLTEANITNMIYDLLPTVADALECLHTNEIAHGDLHIQNILCTSDRCVLIDFGKSDHHNNELLYIDDCIKLGKMLLKATGYTGLISNELGINFENYKTWVQTEGNDYDKIIYEDINTNIKILLTGKFSKWY